MILFSIDVFVDRPSSQSKNDEIHHQIRHQKRTDKVFTTTSRGHFTAQAPVASNMQTGEDRPTDRQRVYGGFKVFKVDERKLVEDTQNMYRCAYLVTWKGSEAESLSRRTKWEACGTKSGLLHRSTDVINLLNGSITFCKSLHPIRCMLAIYARP